jgi:hypothetical protein
MAYMKIRWGVESHATALPSNLLAQKFGHIYNIKLTSDCDNGNLVAVGPWIDFDVFEEAAATEFDGEIVHQMPNGNWLVLVHDAKGAKLVYQTPITPFEKPREFLKESVFYNEAGSITRCYDLYPNDRFEASDLAFDGEPEIGAKIKSIKNKKMVISAASGEGEGEGGDQQPTVEYEAVTAPTGNPSTSGYFELVDGAYVASTDTEVDPTKTYYVVKA